MNIHIFDHASLLYQEASRKIIDLVKSKPDAVLGLATGQSPVGIYHEMIKDQELNQTDYHKITTINLDEYVGLGPDHPKSYHQFMHRELFKPLKINPEQTHIPCGITRNLVKECKLYDQLIESNPIDLQILGIGSNGHIGFNEPMTSFQTKTHIITLDEKTRLDNSRYFEDLSQVPKKAITMGIHHIMMAKTIFLVAIGKNKAQAVYEMIKGPVTEKLPASILQRHPDVHVYLDRDASSAL